MMPCGRGHRAARAHMPPNPRTRVAGVQGARRHPSEVTARRRSWMLAPSAPRASLIRTPAVAATDSGRRARELAGGVGRREARYATEPGHPEVSPGAPAPRACKAARRHPGEVGRPPTFLDHGAMVRHPPARPRADHGCRAFRAVRIPISTGGRGGGPRAAGAGIGRPGAGGAKRVIHPTAHLEASPGATAPRACGLRDGVPVKWPLADVAGRSAPATSGKSQSR